jgi:hypothetical protein
LLKSTSQDRLGWNTKWGSSHLSKSQKTTTIPSRIRRTRNTIPVPKILDFLDPDHPSVGPSRSPTSTTHSPARYTLENPLAPFILAEATVRSETSSEAWFERVGSNVYWWDRQTRSTITTMRLEEME